MADQPLVYLNGQVVPYEEAQVSVEERAMQFGDSVYEVIRYYKGHPFRLDRHLARLARSAAGIMLPLPSLDDVQSAIDDLVARQGLLDATVYLQVTRGAGPRTHVLPREPRPFVIAIARPEPVGRPRRPITVVTVSDDRWSRCYLKTTMLLPNTLAKERARMLGANDAIFVRDGFVTEATSSNVGLAKNGTFWTPALSNYILAGITREAVLELAVAEGMPTVEDVVSTELLYSADEVFLTGTHTELTPVVAIDGRQVGNGEPGPVFHQLATAYDRMLGLQGAS